MATRQDIIVSQQLARNFNHAKMRLHECCDAEATKEQVDDTLDSAKRSIGVVDEFLKKIGDAASSSALSVVGKSLHEMNTEVEAIKSTTDIVKSDDLDFLSTTIKDDVNKTVIQQTNPRDNVGLAFINTANSMNNQVDICSDILADRNPDTGVALEWSAEERNRALSKYIKGSLNAYNKADRSLKEFGENVLSTSTMQVGVALQSVRDDLTTMLSVTKYIDSASKKTDADMQDLSAYISSKVARLKLARKMWSL